MQYSTLTIDDKRKGLKASFGKKKAAPHINGFNFITGDYSNGSGMIGYNSDDPWLWDNFWRSTLGMEPPAPLPKGAMAIMIAQHSKTDPVELVPDTITRDKDGITVQWKRIHTAHPDDAEGARPSRFAVLILPTGSQTQMYHDVFTVAEQEKAAAQLAEDVKVFTDGTKGRITVMPVTKLKRKIEFSSF